MSCDVWLLGLWVYLVHVCYHSRGIDNTNKIVVCSCFRLFYCSRVDYANLPRHIGGGSVGFEVSSIVV